VGLLEQGARDGTRHRRLKAREPDVTGLLREPFFMARHCLPRSLRGAERSMTRRVATQSGRLDECSGGNAVHASRTFDCPAGREAATGQQPVPY